MILQARKTLMNFNLQGQPIDREEIVAFATIEAFCSHFPQQASDEDFELLKKTKIIFENEKDRFFKQRRIALSQLAQHLKKNT